MLGAVRRGREHEADGVMKREARGLVERAAACSPRVSGPGANFGPVNVCGRRSREVTEVWHEAEPDER